MALSQFECFQITVQDYIAHLQFSRPDQLNSMNKAFWVDLPRAIAEIETQTDARAIVISSSGKHFSAGIDLSVLSDPAAFPMTPDAHDSGRLGENLRRIVMQLQDSLSSLERTRLPVLTAIQGGCIGGAVDLVCAADMRYCSADSYFTIKETEVGMTADVGTLQRMPKLIPAGVVRELAYTGRNFSADEALRLGFVNQVFESQEAMLEGVMDIARKIAANSPLAVSGCKEMLNYSRDHSVEDSLRYMATWQAGMFRQPDMLTTFAAKAKKEAPQYPDLMPVKELFDK
ncbi:crotonase/enoyl-CoA hydratase family protein [Bacterioplanoides sp.]|uniref:crotonase/enoyl-CoA hydratase family protein n=1 Tax=Bacterioplanoides sp. TaxID=2066072 RepID=UPI003AFFB511